MNAPVNPQKPMVSIATDTNKRMGFNNFVKDIQGVMPAQPMMAPQMPPSMPQQAMVPQIPAMPASSQSIRGGIGMPMAPVQGFQDGGAAGLTNVEKLLIRDHGFSLNPQGQVVSPAGQIRTVVDGKTTFSAPPTFDQQFAAQQASAIDATNQDRMNQAIASGSNTYQSMATDGSGVITDTSIPSVDPNAGVAEEDPVSTLTPIQQAAQALQDKIDEVGIDTFSRKSDDDRAIRFADGTNLLDKDILAEFGVGKKEFLDAIDDLGVGRANLFRTSGRGSDAGAFQTGLENILLSPEERAIAEQEYIDSAAEADRLKRKEDRQFEQDQADRAARAAGTDPLSQEVARLNEKLGTNMSVSDYVNNYNFVDRAKMAAEDLAGRPGMLMDDLSKLGSSVSQGFSDLTSGISDLFTGGRPSGAISAEAPLARPDIFTAEPFSDPMYGEQGRGFFPPDTEITQSNFPPVGTEYDAGEFVGVGPRLEYMDDDEGFDSAVYVPPSVTTDLGISLGGDTADRSGVLPSSDLGRLLSGDPQVVDNVIKLLAVDPDKTKRDLLSTATTTFGPYGSSVSGSGDAPVIGGVPQLGTLQNLDFTNQLQDTVNPLDLSGFEQRFADDGRVSDPYTSTEVIKDLAKQVGSAGIESAALKVQGAGDLLDRQINEANSPAGIAESIYGGNFPTRFGQGSLNVMSGYDPYEVDPSIINALRGTDLQVPGSGLFGGDLGTMGYSGVRDLGPSQQDAEYVPTTAASDFMKDTVGTDALLDLSKRIEDSVSEQGREEVANNIITGDIVKKEYTIPESVPFIGGEKVSGLGVDNFSWGDNPSLVGTALQVARGAGDFLVDAPFYFAGLPGMAIALGSNVSEASAASANSIANQVENLFNSGEIENLQAYKDDIAITGDADLTKQRLAANAKESILRTGLVEGTFETLAGGLAAKPTAVLNTLFKGTLNKPVKATAVAVGSPTSEGISELLGNVSENVGFQVIDPMVEPGRGGVASFGAGFKEGMSPGVVGAGTSLLSSSQTPSGPTTVAGDPRVELQEGLAQAETELQNEIDNLSKGEEIAISKAALENAGLDPALIDPVLREAGVIENPPDQIAPLTPIPEIPSSLRSSPPTMESLEEEYLKASQEGNTDKMIEALTLRQDAQVNAPKTGVRFEQTDPDGGFEQNVNVPYSTDEDLNNYLREKHSSSRTSQSEINTGSDINNELDNLANDETNTQSDGDNEAQVLSDASSTTDITNIVNTDTTTDTDPVVEIVNQTNPPAEEDPVVVESDPPISIPPSGDSDTPKSEQERRDYSRMREILEQRARRMGGTAPGLGYKPVEAISNTLKSADTSGSDFLTDMMRGDDRVTRFLQDRMGFNQGGPVPSTLDKAADDFLDALRFG